LEYNLLRGFELFERILFDFNYTRSFQPNHLLFKRKEFNLVGSAELFIAHYNYLLPFYTRNVSGVEMLPYSVIVGKEPTRVHCNHLLNFDPQRQSAGSNSRLFPQLISLWASYCQQCSHTGYRDSESQLPGAGPAALRDSQLNTTQVD
jgi:hypothetical protein